MRRTGLFSATGTGGGAGTSGAGNRGMKELMMRAGMMNPVWVNVATATQPEQTQKIEVGTPNHGKLQLAMRRLPRVGYRIITL